MEHRKDIIQRNAETKGQDNSGSENASPSFSQSTNKDKPWIDGSDGSRSILIKAEKLATATYMVTDFIPVMDPIRTKIKECSLDFLSDIYTINGASYSERTLLYRKTISAVEKLCGLLGVASSVGFVSGMNYSILRTEYFNLKGLIDSLDEIKGSVDGSFTFKEEFFATDKMIPATVKHDNFKTTGVAGYKGQTIIKDIIDNNMSVTPRLKLGLSKINPLAKRDTPLAESKNSRRESVLRVLKKKNNVTIKDLSEVILGCSEKTIQRELLSMVADGVLKKEGEKRWSRYSLK